MEMDPVQGADLWDRVLGATSNVTNKRTN